ncbi:lysophospholipid acyltransferase family protein [Flavobacteriaceae bacterium SZ-1-7]|uniref:lysophospholipid acyltransferase family protein n=1 Tax=Tamlana sedimenti TaxID=3134126 RepID=UPI0031234392
MVKTIWLYSVRAYLKLAMFFYFKRIEVYGVHLIPKEKSVLFLCNHHNALLDPLIIAIKNKRFLYFLTRAAVFKNPLIAKLLGTLQMIPVFRIRDGWLNLNNNSAIFKTCSKLLKEKEAVVIFPEGNHNLNRTVRPLSKGFTRIVFETLEQFPETDLQLIPVGINYEHAEKFPDSASLFFGNPIPAKDFVLKDKNESVIFMKNSIQLEISKLTTHIPSENYGDTLNRLNELQVNFLNPISVNKTISSNFRFVESVGKKKNQFIKSFFYVVLIVLLIVPYAIWKLMVQPKVTEIEFLSTFRFVVAITLVPIWVLLLSIVLTTNFGWSMALVYFIGVLGTTLVVVKA